MVTRVSRRVFGVKPETKMGVCPVVGAGFGEDKVKEGVKTVREDVEFNTGVEGTEIVCFKTNMRAFRSFGMSIKVLDMFSHFSRIVEDPGSGGVNTSRGESLNPNIFKVRA